MAHEPAPGVPAIPRPPRPWRAATPAQAERRDLDGAVEQTRDAQAPRRGGHGERRGAPRPRAGPGRECLPPRRGQRRPGRHQRRALDPCVVGRGGPVGALGDRRRSRVRHGRGGGRGHDLGQARPHREGGRGRARAGRRLRLPLHRGGRDLAHGPHPDAARGPARPARHRGGVLHQLPARPLQRLRRDRPGPRGRLRLPRGRLHLRVFDRGLGRRGRARSRAREPARPRDRHAGRLPEAPRAVQVRPRLAGDARRPPLRRLLGRP